jgi:hypothetical protein
MEMTLRPKAGVAHIDNPAGDPGLDLRERLATAWALWPLTIKLILGQPKAHAGRLVGVSRWHATTCGPQW